MRSLSRAQMIQPPPTSGRGSQEVGQVRVRQHLNPLARRWIQPVVLPEHWYSKAFCDVSLPLVVDLGVAKGRFLLKLAEQDKSRNFLGLEIREPLVHQANRCAADAGLSNLFYIACNANVSLGRVLADAPPGVLQEIYVQFCDPWFKKRHAKRRMVNQPLVDTIYQAIFKAQCERKDEDSKAVGDPIVFMQSDVLEVATEMRHHFDVHGGFLRIEDNEKMRADNEGWLLENPLGLPTEREIAVQNKLGNVYRALYHLKDTAS